VGVHDPSRAKRGFTRGALFAPCCATPLFASVALFLCGKTVSRSNSVF
jgi:hypothetical protein